MIRQLLNLAWTLIVYMFVGVAYGALCGALIGITEGVLFTIVDQSSSLNLAPLVWSILWGIACAYGGFWFGLIGGCIGGRVGWGFGGLVAGSMTVHCLSAPVPFNMFGLIPTFILAALGIAIGTDAGRHRPRLPLIGWLRATQLDCEFMNRFEPTRVLLALLAISWGANGCYRLAHTPQHINSLFYDDDDDTDD